MFCFFFFKQKTAYDMRISDWSSDVCSSDLIIKDSDALHAVGRLTQQRRTERILMDSVKSLAVAKILCPGILAADLAGEAQCNLIVHDRNVYRSFERAIIISSIIALDIAPQIVGRSLCSYQNRAAQRIAAEQRSLRPLEHLTVKIRSESCRERVSQYW